MDSSCSPTLAPAPSSDSEWYDYIFKALKIDLLVVIATLMGFILLLGSLRKITSNPCLRYAFWIIFLSTPSVISYCLGNMRQMQKYIGNSENDLFAVWGILVVSLLGSYGTISAFKLGDTESGLTALAYVYLQSYFIGALLVETPVSVCLPLLVLGILLLQRASDRSRSLTSASKTDSYAGVASVVRVVADFMKSEVKRQSQEAADPSSMTGYRYLVGVRNLIKRGRGRTTLVRSPPCYYYFEDDNDSNILTTKEIWQCEGELLSSTAGDHGRQLKDTCLSFALFWMLLCRYAGYPLPEVTSLECKTWTWNFVRYGLMPNHVDSSPTACERAFSVIEEELSFLYDYFYTKSFIFYLNGIWNMLFQLLVVAGYIVIAQFILTQHEDSAETEDEGLSAAHIVSDILVTKIVIYAMILFQLLHIINFVLLTHWSRVGWVTNYVQKQLWRRRNCLTWAITVLCRLSVKIKVRRWKRELGQYSLILSHNSITKRRVACLLIRPLGFLVVSGRGREESKSIKFTYPLKRALLLSVQTNEGQLTNGTSSLERYGLGSEFSWACNLETHTQTILVWHIATTFCKLSATSSVPSTNTSKKTGCHYLFKKRKPATRMESDQNFQVATGLSKYCAYLVAFAPDLLPDPANITFDILKYVIKEADEMFKGCSNMKSKYEKMKAIISTGDQYNHPNPKDPILKKGIWLGQSLVNHAVLSESSLWKMLAEFWTELLLFLAPSDDVDAHIRHLTEGGELITHLWALLTHAGILKRPLP